MRDLRCPFEKTMVGDKYLITRRLVSSCDWIYLSRAKFFAQLDGILCKYIDGKLYKSYLRKLNKKGRTALKSTSSSSHTWTEEHYVEAPQGWVPDGKPEYWSSKWYGWVPVNSSRGDTLYREADLEVRNLIKEIPDGVVCWLVGPKINKNPHGFKSHRLIPVWGVQLPQLKGYDSLENFLRDNPVKGILIKDGLYPKDVVKVGQQDFGYPWPKQEENPTPITGVSSKIESYPSKETDDDDEYESAWQAAYFGA